MNKIILEKNKHIAFIIYPRSGTSVLRDYLCKVTGYKNGVEMFNHNVNTPEIEIRDGKIVKWETLPGRPSMSTEELVQRSSNYLDTLTQLTELKQFSIFTVFVQSFNEHDTALLSKLKARNDIQFIKQERADLLYAILSIIMSLHTGVFHNTDPSIIQKRELPRGALDPKNLLHYLNAYIAERKLINRYFPDIPIIYYEQFQMQPVNMMNMFEGIPKKIVSLMSSKFSENYKEILTNIDEIEDLYEQFVNDHIEYFPQYSGEHQITIPAHQGRQPKILLPA